ncbi:MAG: hypothetical protein ACI4SB_06715, partial [Acutalibacteraceae bacterium]
MWLWEKFHLTVGRRLTKPAVLFLPFLRNGKCAASPHTAALVRIAVNYCLVAWRRSVETPLSLRDIFPSG